MVSWRPRWIKSVFRKRKPAQKGAEEVVLGTAQPPPHPGKQAWCQVSPSKVSRLSRTPPATFFRTTIFTSSRACGAKGCPKQDFCLQEKVAVSQLATPMTALPDC